MQMSSQPTEVTFVVIPRFNMLTLTSVIEPLRIANYLAPRPLYSWRFLSSEAGPVTASNGLTVNCAALDAHCEAAPGTIAVFGSWGAEHFEDRAMFNWLRRQHRNGAIMIGVELGVYPLARAGLLSGRRVTTHWSWKPGFAETFPNIEVCEQLYTIDGNMMSCAGGTAGLDLMLHIVRRDHGDSLAGEVANQILYYPQRPPETAQRFAAGGIENEFHPVVRAAMGILEANIEEPISVPQLCAELGTSQRQLERLFKHDTGCTIVQFRKLLRLQYGRVLLNSTRMSIRQVSVACGFNSMSYFSQCFTKTFGKMPSEYRQAWPENEPAPSWPGTVYSFIQETRSVARKQAGQGGTSPCAPA